MGVVRGVIDGLVGDLRGGMEIGEGRAEGAVGFEGVAGVEGFADADGRSMAETHTESVDGEEVDQEDIRCVDSAAEETTIRRRFRGGVLIADIRFLIADS